MEDRSFLKQAFFMMGIVLIAVLSRLLPHPANMTPIGALALFSGAHFSKKQSLSILFFTMFISDVFLGFHSTMPFVYGALMLGVFLGGFLKKYTVWSVATVTVLSSILFFLITNFGVWMTTTMYAHTLQGLINAYVMGIPFFRNTLMGDMIYSSGLFYGLSLFEKMYYKYQLSS